MSGQSHVTTHRLRFNDTDALGHVNNAVFAVMLEQGRAELVRAAGMGTHSTGHMIVIVRMELDFVAEMSWPGEVRIETEVARLGNRSFHLRQRLTEGDTLCGRAVTVLVMLDRTTRRALPLTDAHRAALTPWLAPDGPAPS